MGSSIQVMLQDKKTMLYYAVAFVVPKEVLVEALSDKDRPYEDIAREATFADRDELVGRVMSQVENLGHPTRGDSVYLLDKEGRCEADLDDLVVTLMNNVIKDALFKLSKINMAQNMDYFRKLQGNTDVLAPIWERHDGAIGLPTQAGALIILVSEDRKSVVARLSSGAATSPQAARTLEDVESTLGFLASRLHDPRRRLKTTLEYRPRDSAIAP